jgi:hypothetical protein
MGSERMITRVESMDTIMKNGILALRSFECFAMSRFERQLVPIEPDSGA